MRVPQPPGWAGPGRGVGAGPVCAPSSPCAEAWSQALAILLSDGQAPELNVVGSWAVVSSDLVRGTEGEPCAERRTKWTCEVQEARPAR